MKWKFRVSLFLLTFILLFSTLNNISFAINLPNRVVFFSERGQAVKDVQIALNSVGYNLAVDGIYGQRTKSGLIDFQRKHPTLAVDGSYGPKTRQVLLEAIESKEVEEEPEPKPQLESEAESEPEPVVEPEPQERVAYLTFDDGPSKTVTPDILRILKDYNIEATFFLLGTMAEKSPEIVMEIFENGHSIGNHGYSHKYKVIYKNMDNFLSELNGTDRILKNILGEDFQSSLFRFPGGSFEAYKNPYINAAKERGYKVYDWNSLNGDAEALNVPKARLINNLKQTENAVKSGDLIVLMHDTYGKETTVQALPEIIEYLRDKGYVFKKLTQ